MTEKTEATKRRIQDDTRVDARSAARRFQPWNAIQDSSRIAHRASEAPRKPRLKNGLWRLSISVVRASGSALRRSSTWLRKAALNAATGIRGYLSLTTLTPRRKLQPLRNLSPTGTLGDQRNSELKLGSVVSFAPTAIADILWNSRDITPTMTSEPLCREFMTDTISASKAQQAADGIRNGTLDFATISLEEYLQVSFLQLYHGAEVHIEQKVVYGGGVYALHACLSKVVPPAQVAELRNKT